MENYDIAVLGGGVAGISAAVHASELGAKVCLIERARMGGTSCLRPYFLNLSGVEPGKLFETAKGRVDVFSSQWTEENIVLKKGEGLLISNTEILIRSEEGEEIVKSGKIVVATGSVPIPNPAMPFDGETILSPDDIFTLRDIPENVLIVGGGKMGCELATFFNRCGSKVFLCDDRPHAVADQDPDIVAALEDVMKKQRIKLLLNKKPVSMFKEDGKVDITLNGEIKFSIDKIIIAGLRRANTGVLDSTRLGLRLGERSEILVNEKMESSALGIYAAGSVTGCGPDPVLSEEGARVAVKNALGKEKALNPEHVPVIIYTDPEVASVGCSIANAHYKGYRAVEGRCDHVMPGHSLAHPGTGLFKVVADKTTKKVIGVHIFWSGASEMISLAALAVKKGLTASDLAALSCGWPSRFQGVKRAARICLDKLSNRRQDG